MSLKGNEIAGARKLEVINIPVAAVYLYAH